MALSFSPDPSDEVSSFFSSQKETAEISLQLMSAKVGLVLHSPWACSLALINLFEIISLNEKSSAYLSYPLPFRFYFYCAELRLHARQDLAPHLFVSQRGDRAHHLWLQRALVRLALDSSDSGFRYL